MQQNYVYSPSNYPFTGPNPNPSATYNQWSPNSITSTPVSTAVYGTTATASWAHTVPALMPWMPEGNNSNADPIVRFSAPIPPDPCTSRTATAWELLNNLGASKTSANLHLKRRTELDELDTTPQKQYITEEKMAARMQQMHISNNYTVPLQNSPFGPYGCEFSEAEKSAKSIEELESMLPQTNVSKITDLQNRSFVLAPELKSLVEPEKLFAKTIMNSIERPTLAVVLWKPPHGCVKDIMESSHKKENDRETANDSDNNVVSLSSPPMTSGMEESNNNPGFSSSFLPGKTPQNLASPFFSASSLPTDDISMEA